jgi:hypothetical protein
MDLTPTTPALPKNIHMSYEYELIVCQSDKEAIELIKKLVLTFFELSRVRRWAVGLPLQDWLVVGRSTF